MRSVSCHVYQTLSTSGVYVEFAGTKKDDFLDDGPVDVYLHRSRVKFQAYATPIEVTLNLEERCPTLKQRVFPSSEPIPGRGSRTLVAVEFALANGAQFFLERRINGKPLGELTLETGDWRVNILPLSAEHQSIEEGGEPNFKTSARIRTLPCTR